MERGGGEGVRGGSTRANRKVLVGGESKIGFSFWELGIGQRPFQRPRCVDLLAVMPELEAFNRYYVPLVHNTSSVEGFLNGMQKRYRLRDLPPPPPSCTRLRKTRRMQECFQANSVSLEKARIF